MNLEYKQEKKIIFKLHLHSIWSFRHPAKPLFMGFSAIFQATQTRFWQLYIMSIKLYIAIFCIIILNILCILYRFGTFCKHFAIIITSNHSSDISLCTPGTHPLKYEMHSYCRLKSAYGLL